MGRKKGPEPPAPPAPPRRRFGPVVLLVALVIAFVAGLIVLGQWGRGQIRDQERYAVPFADIDCPAPPGLSRREFLDEVQYLARLPERLGILDDVLSKRLEAGFGKHPWVEKVEKINLQPPRQIQVQLRFRRPVLAVRTKDGLLAVDGQGVRLPKNAATDGLPVLESAAAPQGPAGTRWGDARVEERARQLK